MHSLFHSQVAPLFPQCSHFRLYTNIKAVCSCFFLYSVVSKFNFTFNLLKSSLSSWTLLWLRLVMRCLRVCTLFFKCCGFIECILCVVSDFTTIQPHRDIPFSHSFIFVFLQAWRGQTSVCLSRNKLKVRKSQRIGSSCSPELEVLQVYSLLL